MDFQPPEFIERDKGMSGSQINLKLIGENGRQDHRHRLGPVKDTLSELRPSRGYISDIATNFHF